MALNTVSLVFTEQDAGGGAGAGLVTIAPTATVVAAGQTVVGPQPVSRSLSSGTLTVSLVATDNTGTTPAAGFWAYEITLPGWSTPQLYLLPFANGATQQFSNLVPVVAQTTYGPSAPGYLPLSGGVMAGALSPAVVTLSQSGGAVAVDASKGNDFRLTLTASGWTISNPANPVDGQVIEFQLAQDATGSRTVSWGTAYDFGTAGAPTLTTTASKMDRVGFKYRAAAAKWDCSGSALGFAA